MIKFVLLFVTFCTSFSYSQILIPYKKGDKFGLSDTNGRLIVAPVYDYIRPYPLRNDYYKTNYFFLAERKDTTTLFLQDKIFISGHYEKFEPVGSEFIKATKKHNSYSQDLYTLQGEKVNMSIINQKDIAITTVDSQIIEELTDLKGKKVIVTATKYERSLWLYDVNSHTIESCIVSYNPYQFNFEFETINNKRFLILYNINEDPEKEKIAVSYSGQGKFTTQPYYLLKKTIQKEIVVEEATNEGSMEDSFGPGDDSGFDFKNQKMNRAYPNGHIEYSFIVQNQQLYFRTIHTTRSAQDECLNDTVYKLIKDRKITEDYSIERVTDWKYSANNFYYDKKCSQINFVTYTYKGKKGLLLTDNIFIKPSYDSLVILYNGIDTVALAGIKDEKTQQMKFGLLQLNGTPLTKIEFDEFDIYTFKTISLKNDKDKVYRKINFNEFLVSKDNFNGIISINGKVIVPCIYDSIVGLDLQDKNRSYSIIHQNKLGGLHNSDNGTRVFIAPQFEHRYLFWQNYMDNKGFTVLIIKPKAIDKKSDYYALPSGRIFYEP